jgi:hypothetical protein
MNRAERIILGRSRIIRNLERLTIANWRTLEQKVSDAGPNHMRVDPHLLTQSKKGLIAEKRIIPITDRQVEWYALQETPDVAIERRLRELRPIHRALSNKNVAKRLGDSLEIAFFLAAKDCPDYDLLGGFDLSQRKGNAHLYEKDEPGASIRGKRISGHRKLDFILRYPDGYAGVEIKNIREWIYPDRPEVKEMLQKCLELDAIPILLARRIHISTFFVLNKCGVILWQNFNQLYADIDEEIAIQAKHKDKLGYHDIRIGHQPDRKMIQFANVGLPTALPAARQKFEEYKDLLTKYAFGEYTYKQFAGIAKLRSHGFSEDLEPYQEDDAFRDEDYLDLF